MNSRNTQVLSVSLPPAIYQEIVRMSKREKLNKSALFREMVRIYSRWTREREWQKIRTMGKDIKKKFNLRNEDDLLALIHND